MENIYIENTKTKYHPFVNQCQIIMRNSMVDSFSCKGRGDNLGFYSEEPSIVRNLFIEGIDVNQMYIDFITGLKKIEAEGCSFENRNGTSYSPFLFNHFNDLKEAYFSGCTFGGQGLNLNGCGKLERLFCVDIGHVNEPEAIDVRNTPSLKEFSCYGYAKEILFDSHMNDVNIDCEGLNILQMIPDCYTGEGEGSFRYDQRYEYVYKHLPDGGYEYEKTIDHGRGWWYPGEPASKSHSRQ